MDCSSTLAHIRRRLSNSGQTNACTFREARVAGVFVSCVGRFSCRGHLTRTEGRDDATTTGEGRQKQTSPVKRKEQHCDLQATASSCRLKRRSPRVRCAACSWSRVAPQPTLRQELRIENVKCRIVELLTLGCKLANPQFYILNSPFSILRITASRL